jgi:hypothetical protein
MAGGIFLGVDHSFYDIGSIAEGDFYVKLILRYKTDGFLHWIRFRELQEEAFLTEQAHTT